MRFSSARHASINRLASLLSKASSRSFQIAAFLRGRRVEKFMWLDVLIVDANTRKDLPIIMMEQEIMEANNYHPPPPPLLFLVRPVVVKPLKFLRHSFMKLVLVQSDSVLEVGLSVLHRHVVWLSSSLPRGWRMRLVFVSVEMISY
uniref:Uncharacterized protein n=1 Tax=Brassica oleracea TaxID=3712 RepID=A0A3P6DMW7_BRAOL|nr:unnamed protein product [Brassica oleracea]